MTKEALKTLIHEQSGARESDLLPLLESWLNIQTSDRKVKQAVIEEARGMLEEIQALSERR